MTNAWKQWDFSGSGLQTLNLELTKRLRQRRLAYGLWLLFPLGLHAFYLHERRIGLAYLAATALLIALWLMAPWPYSTGLSALFVGGALIDVVTLEGRLVAYNKALRIALSLRPETQPPPGFQGRYTDKDVDISDYLAIKNQEQAGHPVRNAPSPGTAKGKSFQEQEAALREFAERQKRSKNHRS
ncbi:MAG: TM2 domain-containing protein [Acidiferrobacter sp.]